MRAFLSVHNFSYSPGVGLKTIIASHKRLTSSIVIGSLIKFLSSQFNVRMHERMRSHLF